MLINELLLEVTNDFSFPLPSLDVAECMDSVLCCCGGTSTAGAELLDSCAFDELLLAIDWMDVSMANGICVAGLISTIFLRTSAQNEAGNGVR